MWWLQCRLVKLPTQPNLGLQLHHIGRIINSNNIDTLLLPIETIPNIKLTNLLTFHISQHKLKLRCRIHQINRLSHLFINLYQQFMPIYAYNIRYNYNGYLLFMAIVNIKLIWRNVYVFSVLFYYADFWTWAFVCEVCGEFVFLVYCYDATLD